MLSFHLINIMKTGNTAWFVQPHSGKGKEHPGIACLGLSLLVTEFSFYEDWLWHHLLLLQLTLAILHTSLFNFLFTYCIILYILRGVIGF